MKRILIALVLVPSLLFMGSCKKEESSNNNSNNPTNTTPSTPEGMIKIGETYIVGAKAKAYVYAKQALFVGYNTLYIALYDSTDGSRLTDGHFSASALMDMGMMTHTCPTEENEEIDSTTNLYSSSFVFIMPSAVGSTWTLTLGYHNHKIDMEGEGALEINVVEPTPAKMLSSLLAADSNAKVFVSFTLPNPGKTGFNDAEFTLHKMASSTSFPAIENYTIEMIPTMPSMGHGSPNNVNPVHVANGHYKGKLNFTMTGLWQVQLKLYKNGTLLTDKLVFEITI
ncbi:MAG: hypothetical protein CFE21_08555 [Bacteroidetes bacterium B1(2017)]|nr:MAG: hypothetical protein CFE21_08555 [Bacteroidetes bacterium B1(2017)]